MPIFFKISSKSKTFCTLSRARRGGEVCWFCKVWILCGFNTHTILIYKIFRTPQSLARGSVQKVLNPLANKTIPKSLFLFSKYFINLFCWLSLPAGPAKQNLFALFSCIERLSRLSCRIQEGPHLSKTGFIARYQLTGTQMNHPADIFIDHFPLIF